MDIKMRSVVYSLVMLIIMNVAEASKKILVERYERWNHPILVVFKEYGISVYKVSYSKDGTCPTFYAKFKYSPDTRAPDAANFETVYFEALKANSRFPYAIVDEEDGMRINVGWTNKKRTVYEVEMDKVDSISLCRNGK